MDKKRFVYETAPKADAANTVTGEKYRFTVLTSRLIRLEYSADGVFEDRASQTVFFRDLGRVNFTKNTENGILTLETDGLKLTYRENEKLKTSLVRYGVSARILRTSAEPQKRLTRRTARSR